MNETAELPGGFVICSFSKSWSKQEQWKEEQ